MQMNPVTSQRQGGVVKSLESTLEWMVKSRNDVSNSSMGLFIIAVLANNFFQFGTNYLALFLFIILTKNTIKSLVSVNELLQIIRNSQMKLKSWQRMFVLCLPRKINSQMKLKLFVVTKPTLHRTIRFAWKVVLLEMSMLFYLV